MNPGVTAEKDQGARSYSSCKCFLTHGYISLWPHKVWPSSSTFINTLQFGLWNYPELASRIYVDVTDESPNLKAVVENMYQEPSLKPNY